MQTVRLLKMLSCLAGLGLLLASCAPTAAPTPKPIAPSVQSTAKPAATPEAKPGAPTPSPKPGADQPKYGGILTSVVATDPADLDVQRQITADLFWTAGPAYSGILQQDPQEPGRIIGDLAEKWQMSSDAKVFTFNLHQGVKSHDGKPFTSDDVKFSLMRLQEFPQLGGAYIPAVDTIETLDENTVKVVLQRPIVDWANLLSHGRILMAPKHVIQEKGSLKSTVIGTGPFKFVNYAPGVQVTLTKNKDYFIAGRPYLDGITFYIIRDAGTQLAAFRTRRVKFIGPANYGIRPSQVDMLKNELGAKVVLPPWPRYHSAFFVLNHDRKPWNDVRVRRAAFLAFDREVGVKVVAEGAGQTGVSWVPPEYALPNEELMKMPGFRKPKDQDIADAKRLMAEAGYPDGVKTTIMVRAAYKDYENIGLVMRDQLAKIGITLDLQIVEFAVYARKRLDRDHDSMALLADFGLSDPNIIYRYISWKYGQLSSTMDDPKMLELLDTQSATMDQAKRKALLYELQYRLAEIVPHILVTWMNGYVGYWAEMKNYKAGYGMYNNHKMQDVWLAE